MKFIKRNDLYIPFQSNYEIEKQNTEECRQIEEQKEYSEKFRCGIEFVLELIMILLKAILGVLAVILLFKLMGGLSI